MVLYIIVGETGSGKTTLTKKLMSIYPQVCVYDIQNEYGLKPFSAKYNNEKFQLPNNKYTFEDFVTFTKRLKGYCFVIEEATGILRGSVGKSFVQSILSKRHTQNRYILIFHSLHRVPMQLYEFADYIYLYKTQDLEMNIKKKYPNLLPFYKELQNAPKYSYKLFKQTNLAKDGRL
jgi:ABC-type phosphate/phosphonate transport system ATPase subunit